MEPRYKFINGSLSIKMSGVWEDIKFENYKLLEVIGEGANAIVLKAKHSITDRVDALKVWLPRSQNQKGEVREQQYLNEIKKIAKLQHPNIVRIYEAKIKSSVYMCSMEYVEGRSLKDWETSKHSIFKKIEIAQELIDTILFYQEKGIIHGDLHNRNVIIDSACKVHLIDFGTSYFAHENQSNERETYLIYELIRGIFGDEFHDGFFEFHKYDLKKINYVNDVRNYSPVLVTRTLKEYIELINLKEQIMKMTDRALLAEYCQHIARGIYLDMRAICGELKSWCKAELYHYLPSFMIAALEDDMYHHANVTEDIQEAECLIYATLYIYFDIFREYKDKMNLEKLKKVYFVSYLNFISEEEYSDLLALVTEFSGVSYIELHEKMGKIYGADRYTVEQNLRGILDEALRLYFGNDYLYISQYILRRFREIEMDQELYYKIKSMSEILMEDFS